MCRHTLLSSFAISAASFNRTRIYSSNANASNLSNASIMASRNSIASSPRHNSRHHWWGNMNSKHRGQLLLCVQSSKTSKQEV
eukprot:scaffold45742_cov20-Cyclotella_meneghiniana.AAC.1